jgi:hypothetical protein
MESLHVKMHGHCQVSRRISSISAIEEGKAASKSAY